jgi:predicted MPP superfamily phosphohydrolase
MEIKNNIKIIIGFLLTVLVFLYLANFVMYQAILLIFGITSASFLAIGVLGILGISMIASLILGMRYYNVFTRTYSLFSMTWMGFFGYFFLASVLYILEFSYIGDPSRFFALILFILVIITGVYGIFHAKKLVIKEISVELPKLPEIWRKRKAVWISDLHVGQINAEKYVARVIEKLKNISPDILFIGGDLFDSPTAKKTLEFILPFRELSVPLGIYFITGNHEGYGDNHLLLQKIKEAGIRILHDEKLILDNLQIIGVDFISTEKEPDFRKVLAILAINKNMPLILLKHEPRYITAAVEAGVSFQISGHTHQGQQWPFEYLTRLIYERFAYGLRQLGDMQVYTSSGTGTWGPPMRIGTDNEIVVFTFI